MVGDVVRVVDAVGGFVAVAGGLVGAVLRVDGVGSVHGDGVDC
jgi:hypothetical protein